LSENSCFLFALFAFGVINARFDVVPRAPEIDSFDSFQVLSHVPKEADGVCESETRAAFMMRAEIFALVDFSLLWNARLEPLPRLSQPLIELREAENENTHLDRDNIINQLNLCVIYKELIPFLKSV
jgi:hypothetical protein